MRILVVLLVGGVSVAACGDGTTGERLPLHDSGFDADAAGARDSSVDGGGQPADSPRTLAVAAYNVRNLDESDDRRFENLARVLIRIDADVLGLSELHTEGTADRLREAVREAGGPDYRHVRHRDGLFESPGIALLSRFPLVHDVNRPVNIEHRCADGTLLDGSYLEARPIIEAGLDTDADGASDLTVFVNHWRSRRGRPRCDTEDHRFRSGRHLRMLMEARAAERPGETLLAVGDFNAYEFEPELADALGARMLPDEVSTPRDLWITWGDIGRLHDRSRNSNDWNGPTNSTYNFQGVWSRLDHIVVSGAALLGGGSWRYVQGSITAVVEPWMLYEGRWPFEYEPDSGDGFSDHLPVRITLTRDASDQAE